MGRKNRFTLPEAMAEVTKRPASEAIGLLCEPMFWLAEHGEELLACDVHDVEIIQNAAYILAEKFGSQYTNGEIAEALSLRAVCSPK